MATSENGRVRQRVQICVRVQVCENCGWMRWFFCGRGEQYELVGPGSSPEGVTAEKMEANDCGVCDNRKDIVASGNGAAENEELGIVGVASG